jgi:hypothetical protein
MRANNLQMNRSRHLCVLVAGLLGLNVSFGLCADDYDGRNLSTGHFILYVEGLDPAETSRILEAAYAEMSRFFSGIEPDRKLQVKIYATRERFQSEFDRLHRMFAAKRKLRDSAGVYFRETACAYLYAQPQESMTRQVLLHELGHEYHDFIRPWDKVPSLVFFDEGLAEYFAQHNWDGKVLRLGVMPIIGKVDYPRVALQQLKNTAQFDLQSVVDGDTDVDYPLAWGLVSFAIEKHRPKFDIWRQGINNDVEPHVVWQKQFGPVTPEFLQSFETWLETKALPWQVVSGEWFPSGDAIQGRALEDEFAVAILNQSPPELSLALNAPSNGIAGAVFGFRGAKNFHVVQHCPDGHWDVMHCEGGAFLREHHRTFPSTSGEANIRIVPGEVFTSLRFGTHTLEVTNAVGRVGLWVKEGSQSFRNTQRMGKDAGKVWPLFQEKEPETLSDDIKKGSPVSGKSGGRNL